MQKIRRRAAGRKEEGEPHCGESSSHLFRVAANLDRFDLLRVVVDIEMELALFAPDVDRSVDRQRVIVIRAVRLVDVVDGGADAAPLCRSYDATANGDEVVAAAIAADALAARPDQLAHATAPR